MAASQQDFEVQQIIADRIIEDNTYYLIRWQVTVTSNIQPFLERHQAEIKSVVCTRAMHRITWKDSWIPASALKDTYLLLKLYKCRLDA